MKIVADDKIPFLRGTLEPFADLVYIPGSQITKEILKDVDAILIRTRTKCNADLLDGTNVKFISTATIGFDHIDTEYCKLQKIKWANAPGCNSSSVQQYIISALFMLREAFNFTLKDKTIGIIGVGNVGSKVEKAARTLGMNVLLNDPPRSRKEGPQNFVSLDTILSESDIITVHVPLNKEGPDKTWHLFDEKCFGRIKKGAWFFNTSRGEVADTAAIKNALSSRKITGAVIDVWENEPDIDLELISQCFIATPHIAGYSTDGKANGTSMAVNSLCRNFDLPLKNWYPDNLPVPHQSVISIDGEGKTPYDILKVAIFQSYNIKDDDLRLRTSPDSFEKQRGNYPVRREFPSYSVNLKSGTGKTLKMLNDLGFRIVP